MILTFLSGYIRNTTMVNSTGQIVFTTHTPQAWSLNTTTTVRRFRHDTQSSVENESSVIAEIIWDSFRSPIFRLHGAEIEVKRFMQESNSQKYIFAGPDGRPYKWRFHDVISLELNDSSKTPIARYHRRSLGILGKRHDPYLEIFPAGEHMMDVIVTTFIYLEKLRRVEERAARRRANNARFAAQNAQFAAQSAAQASASAATANFMATGI